MKKSLVMMLLVLPVPTLVQQAVRRRRLNLPRPAVTQAQKPEIKNPAEYNAYINAIQQRTLPKRRRPWKRSSRLIPASVMKTDALELLMVAYQQAGDAQKTLDARQPHPASRPQQRTRSRFAGL